MKKNIYKKQGYALVTVMGIMVVMAITFAMLHQMGGQSVFSGKLLKDRTKATAYAEAGVEFAYAILRDDFETRNDLSAFSTGQSSIDGNNLTTTYGEGSYTLSLTNMNNGKYTIVNSVGKCGASSVEVEALVEDSEFSDNGNNGPDVWGMTAFGGGTGDSRIGGGGFIDGDLMYFNGSVNASGGATVTADISSAGTVSGANSGITILNNQPIITIPKLESRYESFDYYEDNAAINNSGYDLKKNNSYTVPGNGIMYVDGPVTIKGQFNGTIICTGTVKFSSGGNIIAGASGIAVATTTGLITYGTGADSTGLFYSESGGFKQIAAGGTLTGQLIIGGVIDKTGGDGIVFAGATAPGVPEPAVANPVIAGWQK